MSANSAPPPDDVVKQMLAELEKYLPDGSNPLPADDVSLVDMTERTVGLGNRRGNQTLGSFAVVALKGGRLDALVRFQLWADSPEGVNLKLKALRERLLQAQDELWPPHRPPENSLIARFLRLTAEGTSMAERVSDLDAWRKTADYRVLYEFHYDDSEGAESLIARIPIEVDSEYGESTVVTDEMIRWDHREAPTLEVRGGVRRVFRVGALSILAFLPEVWDGSGVTISASVGGVVREREFASVREFRDAFDLEEETVELGGNPYVAGRLVFPNADFPDPLMLKGGEDIFRIQYADERFLSENEDEADAVVYLRVLS